MISGKNPPRNRIKKHITSEALKKLFEDPNIKIILISLNPSTMESFKKEKEALSSSLVNELFNLNTILL